MPPDPDRKKRYYNTIGYKPPRDPEKGCPGSHSRNRQNNVKEGKKEQ